jgi:hypothetical protein
MLKYLMSSESGHIDPTVAGPVVQAVRKHFLGFKGNKDEVVQTLRLNKNEIDRAVWIAIRDLLKSPELVTHLSKKNKAQKKQMALKATFDPWFDEKPRHTPPGIRRTLSRAAPTVSKRRWGKV